MRDDVPLSCRHVAVRPVRMILTETKHIEGFS